MELVQALFVATEGQTSEELLDGGVARPDRQEDQIALVIADASVGHHVGAFVDAIQRGGRSVCGHGGVLGSTGTAPPAGASTAPGGGRKPLSPARTAGCAG
ncbi:hypothetical protein [Xylella fastidiosa]|uniref:hypothetical protein n=1 Tax=Xylella fastidiosa TaxID=2371 RepID=UPI0003F6A74B